MARPIKQGFDYFAVNSVFNDQIQALRMIHKNDGFAWIFSAWQRGYQNGTADLDLRGPFEEMMAATNYITPVFQKEIVTTCLKLGLLAEKEPGLYVMNGVLKRLEYMNQEREKWRNYKEKGFSSEKTGFSIGKEGFSTVKGKERKGKEIKEKECKTARALSLTKEEFSEKLTDWEPERIDHYFAAAENYSNKGNKFMDWIKAVRNWDRKNPDEWKRNIQTESEFV